MPDSTPPPAPGTAQLAAVQRATALATLFARHDGPAFALSIQVSQQEEAIGDLLFGLCTLVMTSLGHLGVTDSVEQVAMLQGFAADVAGELDRRDGAGPDSA